LFLDMVMRIQILPGTGKANPHASLVRIRHWPVRCHPTPAPDLPEGMRYAPDLISFGEERALLKELRSCCDFFWNCGGS
jgi:hypothetical protein